VVPEDEVDEVDDTFMARPEGWAAEAPRVFTIWQDELTPD
jgi:hypothetical protein